MDIKKELVELEKKRSKLLVMERMFDATKKISPGMGFKFVLPGIVQMLCTVSPSDVSIELLLSEDRARALLRIMREMQTQELESWERELESRAGEQERSDAV